MPSILKIRLREAQSKAPCPYQVVAGQIRLLPNASLYAHITDDHKSKQEDLPNDSYYETSTQMTSFVKPTIGQKQPEAEKSHDLMVVRFVWQEDFRIETTDDSILQDCPLEIRLVGRETLIGTVLVDLNLLLTPTAVSNESSINFSDGDMLPDAPMYSGPLMITRPFSTQQDDESKWTIDVVIRIEHFEDRNPWRSSSAGIQLTSMTDLDEFIVRNRRATSTNDNFILGALVESVVACRFDIESPSSSNTKQTRSYGGLRPETPQDEYRRAVYRLAGRARRLLGCQALEMGAEAVVGVQWSMKTLLSADQSTILVLSMCGTAVHRQGSFEDYKNHLGHYPHHYSGHPANNSSNALYGMASPTNHPNNNNPGQPQIIANIQHPASSLELPLLTVKKALGIRSVGGLVTAKLVKCLPAALSQKKRPSKPSIFGNVLTLNTTAPIADSETDDLSEQYQNNADDKFHNPEATIPNIFTEWLDEARQEVRGHARLMRCNAVFGYSEQILPFGGRQKSSKASSKKSDESDDSPAVFLIVAWGTAVRYDFSAALQENTSSRSSSSSSGEEESRSENATSSDDSSSSSSSSSSSDDSGQHRRRRRMRRKKRLRAFAKHKSCAACHLPFRRARSPLPAAFSWCKVCRGRHVPEILLATIDCPPELLLAHSKPASKLATNHARNEREDARNVVRAFVSRPISLSKGSHDKGREALAKGLSAALPFLEYDLHRQLVWAMRLKGFNSLWSCTYRYALTASMNKYDDDDSSGGREDQDGGYQLVAVAEAKGALVVGLPVPTPLRCRLSSNAKQLTKNSLAVADEKNNANVGRVECWVKTLEVASRKACQTAQSLLDTALHSEDAQTTQNQQEEHLDGNSSSSSSSSSSEEEHQDPLAFIQIDDEADADVLETLLHQLNHQNKPLKSSESLDDGFTFAWRDIKMASGMSSALAKAIYSLLSLTGDARVIDILASPNHPCHISVILKASHELTGDNPPNFSERHLTPAYIANFHCCFLPTSTTAINHVINYVWKEQFASHLRALNKNSYVDDDNNYLSNKRSSIDVEGVGMFIMLPLAQTCVIGWMGDTP